MRRIEPTHLFATIIASVTMLGAAEALAQTDSTFTYQGELKENGGLANGAFDMDFSLWNAVSSGTQIGSTILESGVVVVDGKFAVELDFGAATFDNSGRWLEIGVDGLTLSPRNPITRSPYSIQTRGIYVDGADRVGVGTTAPDPSARMSIDANGTLGAIDARSSVAQWPTISAVNTTGGPVLWADGNSDVELTHGGVVVIGQTSSYNLAIDRNEIMARFDGGTSPLLLNFDGGDTVTGGLLLVGSDLGGGLGQLKVVTTTPGAVFAIDAHSSHDTVPTILATNSNAGPVLWADGTSDVSASGGGVVVVGLDSGPNIAIDQNEIMSRNAGAPSTLYLNAEGGDVRMGDHEIAPAYAYGTIAGDGSIISASANVQSVTHVQGGLYDVNLSGGVLSSDILIATGPAAVNVGAEVSGGAVRIARYLLSQDTFTNGQFSFVVYRH